MPPPLLAVEGLSVAYGRLLALDAVDLVVPEGALVAVLGPNGAGKSTLLKAIAGLVPAAAGRIMLQGRPVPGTSAHERARAGVCLVPEGRGIFPTLTVADNLGVALDGDAAATRRVVEHFPVLGQRLHQLAGTLSGGEQQMLALARAVGTDPLLLLTDELSLGLAPLLVGMVLDTLARLHEDEGRTLVVVEQYATHALRVANLVYILNRGRLVWAGEPGEVRGSKVLVDSYLGGA